MPKLIKGDRTMRGRPITAEKYERMLAKVDDIRPDDAEIWKGLLRGLWLSGLRLSEALQLSWNADAAITVHLGGRYPMLRIFGEAQKSKRDALLPISPEFGEFLLATPMDERRGLVFRVEGLVRGKPIETQSASRIIARIGEAARVVVDANVLRLRVDKKTGAVTKVPKCATAHDLRRAFGTRWSKRVMPVMLQRLMRHAAIDTTMRYYVEHNAGDVSETLWNWQGSVPGSVGPKAVDSIAEAAATTYPKSLPDNES